MMRQLCLKNKLVRFASLASPIILSRFASISSEIAVVIILSTVDEDHLAAAGLMSAVQHLVMRTGMTLLYPTGIEVSAIKDNSPGAVGRILRASYQNGLLISVVFSLPLAFIGDIAQILGQPQHASILLGEYYRGYLVGVWPAFLTISHQQIAYNLEAKWLSFWLGLARNVLYVVFGYCLLTGNVFGYKLGIFGLGISYGITMSFDALCFLLYYKFHPRFKEYELFKFDYLTQGTLSYSRKILLDGLKMGADAINEFLVNFVGLMLVGTHGASELASAEIANELRALFNVPISGLSQSASLLIRTERSDDQVYYSGFIYSLASLVIPLIAIPLTWTFKNQIISLFSLNSTTTKIDTQLAELLIGVILTGIPALSIQKLFAGAYRGREQYATPFLVNFTAQTVLGLNASFLFDSFFGWGAKGVFLGNIIGLYISAFLVLTFWICRVKLPKEKKAPLTNLFVDTRLANENQSLLKHNLLEGQDHYGSTNTLTSGT